MTQAELGAVHETLAAAIDRAGAEKAELLLAKLALLMAQARRERRRQPFAVLT